MMESQPQDKAYEEEMAEYTAAALGIPLETAADLSGEAPYMGPVFVEDTQELNRATGENNGEDI